MLLLARWESFNSKKMFWKILKWCTMFKLNVLSMEKCLNDLRIEMHEHYLSEMEGWGKTISYASYPRVTIKVPYRHTVYCIYTVCNSYTLYIKKNSHLTWLLSRNEIVFRVKLNLWLAIDRRFRMYYTHTLTRLINYIYSVY